MSQHTVIDQTVAALGYELVEVERAPGGLLRVTIDHPSVEGVAERFITVDDCERVTRQLQHVLEVEGLPYERLEVSSPGLDRPLKSEADFRRFRGEQVEVTLKLPFKGRKRFRGELMAAESGWRLALAPTASRRRRQEARREPVGTGARRRGGNAGGAGPSGRRREGPEFHAGRGARGPARAGGRFQGAQVRPLGRAGRGRACGRRG